MQLLNGVKHLGMDTIQFQMKRQKLELRMYNVYAYVEMEHELSTDIVKRLEARCSAAW